MAKDFWIAFGGACVAILVWYAVGLLALFVVALAFVVWLLLRAFRVAGE